MLIVENQFKRRLPAGRSVMKWTSVSPGEEPNAAAQQVKSPDLLKNEEPACPLVRGRADLGINSGTVRKFLPCLGAGGTDSSGAP